MNTSENPLTSAFDNIMNDAKAQFLSLDAEKLQNFITSQQDVVGEVTFEEVTYLTGGAGASNGIALLNAELDRGEGRQRYELVVRYLPSADGYFLQKSLLHEFLTVRAARAAGLPAPEALWIDADGRFLGVPAFVMKRVPGIAPATLMYSKGPLANIAASERKRLMLKASAFHGRLKKAAIDAAQVPHLLERGKGATAVERELNWWFKEAELRLAPESRMMQRITELYHWLVAHQPDLPPPVLVHGDAQIANIMFNEGEIAAVLDWELSWLGYNEVDLACLIFLTEMLKKVDLEVDGTPTAAEYIASFEEASGGPVQEWDYFMLFSQWICAVSGALSVRLSPGAEAVWYFYDNPIDALLERAKASRKTSV